MITIPIRHRRPGCHWHTNTLEVTEERFSHKRRIRLSLDEGNTVIELHVGAAIDLVNAIADTLEAPS